MFVQHQQRVVGVGDAGDELRAHGLPVVPALGIEGLRLLLGVAHPAEDVQLPTGGDGHGVGPRGLAPVEAAHAALGRQGEGGQERELGREQGGFGFLHAELGGAVIGVVGQPLFYQSLQDGVGEDFPPIGIPEVRGVSRLGERLAVEVFGHGLDGLVSVVDAATAQGGGGGGQ